jgi:hypothetical protein
MAGLAQVGYIPCMAILGVALFRPPAAQNASGTSGQAQSVARDRAALCDEGGPLVLVRLLLAPFHRRQQPIGLPYLGSGLYRRNNAGSLVFLGAVPRRDGDRDRVGTLAPALAAAISPQTHTHFSQCFTGLHNLTP